jgi:HlyD family secretion protein
MMKHYTLFGLLILSLTACNSKSSDKSDAENAKQTLEIHQVIGVGKIIPESDIVQLSSPVNGIVSKIHKKENDTVTIGSVILELDHQLEDAKISQLNNQIATQTVQIKVDEANVDEIKTKIANAKVQLQRLENLLQKGAETQQTVDDAATDVKVLNSNLNRLEANVQVSKSKLQETRAALNTAILERDQKIIKSPVNGRLLELTVLIGGSVSTQESLAQISPEGKIIAICEIDESNADKIAIGQKGWIRNVGSRDTLTTGTVYVAFSFLRKKSLFTDQSGEKEDRRVRTIKMQLDNPETLLLNSRVECVIDVSSNPKK